VEELLHHVVSRSATKQFGSDGMGEHEIALMPTEVQIMLENACVGIRVLVNVTKGEFKALPQ